MNDILLDEAGDLAFENGDLSVGESSQQEIELLLSTHRGEWKESPLTGAGLPQTIKSRATRNAIRKIINSELERDGFVDVDTLIDFPTIRVDAKRKL